MATKNLKYFMRPELKEEKIVDVPGPINDENGEPIMFQVKKLSRKHIDDIYDHYKRTRPALDKNKKPYVVDGKLVMQEEKDYSKALREVVVEALVYPDLRAQELLEYYNCNDSTELVRMMFDTKEYEQIVKIVNSVLGISEDDEEESNDDIESAKN